MVRPDLTSEIEGLAHVRHAVTKAAEDCGRDPAAVCLVAVSKTVDADRIAPLISHGQQDFGENRVQEAVGKWPELRRGGGDVRLHLIGPLQSNKTAAAVQHFDVIHSVDRRKIAAELAKEIQKQGRHPQLLVQVNTGLEPQKAGIAPIDADNFLKSCRIEFGLTIGGLMAIPPDGEQASPHFALLAQIARRNGLLELSMGMSGDYALAIQLGATMVRVGSAIFGARPAAH